MGSRRVRWASALLSGALFGGGLVLSGMTDPARVLGFLDVAALGTGTWDPTLAFVLGGAVGVTLLGYRLVWRRPQPFAAPDYDLPTATRIEAPLVLGAALFGLGWGLSGLCPGPAMAGLVGPFGWQLVGFAMALLIGLRLGRWVKARF